MWPGVLHMTVFVLYTVGIGYPPEIFASNASSDSFRDSAQGQCGNASL
jgi:hypothetical protein